MDSFLFDLARLLVVLFFGAIFLTPVLGLTVRFAIKPLIESMAQLRDPTNGHEIAALSAKIEALEAGLAEAEEEIRSLKSTQEFDRNLLSGESMPTTD